MANEIEKITVDGTTYTIQDANAVPNTRKINNTALSSDITLSGNDILLTGYTQGSDTSAVLATDKINEAIAKHENKIATNQTNISSVEDMICDNEFSTSTAYAVGDIVTYENGLYEFTSAHSAGAWTGNDVTEVNVTDMVSTKIGSSDYGSQNTGGTVRVWTTTVGSDTVLHISNQAAT